MFKPNLVQIRLRAHRPSLPFSSCMELEMMIVHARYEPHHCWNPWTMSSSPWAISTATPRLEADNEFCTCSLPVNRWHNENTKQTQTPLQSAITAPLDNVHKGDKSNKDQAQRQTDTWCFTSREPRRVISWNKTYSYRKQQIWIHYLIHIPPLKMR